MKRILLILAAFAWACAWSGVASARLGSLGRNDTVVTNVTDVTPGNYETVSNRAMTASAYTDAALGAFAATGAVRRAEIYGTPTRWTDATGCVWEVVTNTYEWKCYYGLPDEIYEVSGPEVGEVVCTWFLTGSKGTTGNAYSASPTATHLEFNVASVPGGIIVAKLEGIASTNYVGRTALTNDIPRTAGDVGAYPAASGSALESGKQDRLPYPTNAIPFSAIDGAPSGGQEWRVVNYDVEVDTISFVTNGMANLIFLGGVIGGAVITNGWPDGASMFVRGQFSAETSYTLGANVRLVGYGTWPTNNFQSVWWRSGTNIYVNVILEE